MSRDISRRKQCFEYSQRSTKTKAWKRITTTEKKKNMSAENMTWEAKVVEFNKNFELFFEGNRVGDWYTFMHTILFDRCYRWSDFR